MKSLTLTVLLASVALPLSANAEQIRLKNSADFKWERTPEGVEFAALQGNRFSEAYQALVKLPAGTISPPHIKSANMYGVMLQGVMTYYGTDQDPKNAKRIAKGGFYSIPEGFAHISACVSSVPCIVYLYQDGAFDFLPVQR